MNNKIKIISEVNKNNYYSYILEKHQDFFPWLQGLIDKLDPALGSALFSEKVSKSGKSKFIKKDIKKLIDVHEAYDSDDSRIDAFYGIKRIFLAIYIPSKLRKILISYIEDTTVWKKTKK